MCCEQWVTVAVGVDWLEDGCAGLGGCLYVEQMQSEWGVSGGWGQACRPAGQRLPPRRVVADAPGKCEAPPDAATAQPPTQPGLGMPPPPASCDGGTSQAALHRWQGWSWGETLPGSPGRPPGEQLSVRFAGTSAADDVRVCWARKRPELLSDMQVCRDTSRHVAIAGRARARSARSAPGSPGAARTTNASDPRDHQALRLPARQLRRRREVAVSGQQVDCRACEASWLDHSGWRP